MRKGTKLNIFEGKHLLDVVRIVSNPVLYVHWWLTTYEIKLPPKNYHVELESACDSSYFKCVTYNDLRDLIHLTFNIHCDVVMESWHNPISTTNKDIDKAFIQIIKSAYTREYLYSINGISFEK